MNKHWFFTILLFSFFCVSNINAKHITGGYINYSVLFENESTFTLDVELSVFRDPFGEGADFDQNLELGLYRINASGELEHIQTYNSNPYEILEIESDFLTCRNTISEYELGKYNLTVQIPNDGFDYQLAYQRCCRSHSIQGVVNVEESGMLFTTRISSEALILHNSSPSLTDVDNRFFDVNELYDIEMSFVDVDGDIIVITPMTPYEVGGIDGVTFGDPQSCEGITPSPQNCPPMFDQITYESGFSVTEPFGSHGELIDNGDGNFSFSCSKLGLYLLGFKIEEFRDGQLLTTSNYETSMILNLKEAKEIEGQLYYDENENGLYDLDEIPFPLAPEIVNDYCSYIVSDSFMYEASMEPDIAQFQNNAQNYTFSNGTNQLYSPLLNIDQPTEFDIGFIASRPNEELSINIYNELPLCNTEGDLVIELLNIGNLPTEGVIVLSNINNLTILSCECDYEEVEDELIIQISSLDALDGISLVFTVQYPNEESVGEPLTVTATYNSTNNPSVTASADFEDTLLCAFDPNDIAVTPYRSPTFVVENHERLFVKIRFENMGNYFASSVSIKQQLNENLDPSSIKVMKSSHEYKLMTSRNSEGSNLKFLFDDINLPGTNNPIQEEREGFLIYSIDIKPNLNIGTKITHDAEIIFDLNQPIFTNSIYNVIGLLPNNNFDPNDFSSVSIFPNPTKETLYIKNAEIFDRYFISNSTQKYLSEGITTNNISVKDLIPGIYMITFVASNGYRESRKFVKTE